MVSSHINDRSFAGVNHLPLTVALARLTQSATQKFIHPGDQIVSKIYMTRVKGENTRLRYHLARLHRKILYYSKTVEMLKYSIRLLLHYLKYSSVLLFS